MNEILAQTGEQPTSWPDALLVLALLAAGCFVAWILFRD